MKFLATTIVALMQLLGSQAHSGHIDMFQAAYEVQSGAQNVQAAIDAFEEGDVQPECLHPTGNCTFLLLFRSLLYQLGCY